MSEIKCVLFDIGGVLVDWHMSWITSEVSARFRINEHKIRNGFAKHLHKLDSGKIDEKDFWKKIANYTGSESLNHIDESLWNTYFRKNAKPNQNVISLTQNLKEHYTMGIVSNIEKVTHQVVEDWNILEHFEHKFMSYQIGYSKPDPRIYQHAINQLDFKPQEIVFIDDKPSNIESAQNSGINGILFSDYEQLQESLKRLDMIV